MAALVQLRKMVDEATARYAFFRSEEKVLLRQAEQGAVERLVNGSWVRVSRPRDPEREEEWERLEPEELCYHARKYFVEDLGAKPIGWDERKERLKRLGFYRYGNPPMKGGSRRRLPPEMFDRSREAFSELLGNTRGEALEELKEEALLGYEHQRERIAAAEQRANFFLGTAGLTTSLVLANAGLLLGSDKLDSPWRALSAAALLVASICAITAGLRALQATMLTFGRTPPNSVPRVMKRRRLGKEAMVRAYVGALLVGQHRLSAIADWKIMRMKEARRWFVAASLGVVALTVLVLVDVFLG